MKSSSVEQIKERLDVVQVLGSYIKLEKAGASFKARCPFHNEKTPSFFVSPARGTYYCFGCGAKGDIFTFVEEFEGLDFVGALKMLADQAGVILERFEPERKGEKDELYSLMEKATVFFEDNLKENKEAVEYLKGRGLTPETIKGWRLGYAKNDWRTLLNEFGAAGISKTRLEAVGLVKSSEKAKEDGYYDVFRGRIMFPIADSAGKVIAFSGRIFDEAPDSPKYINSPETALFTKSETLYGFDKAKVAIRKKDYALLVEGQMDLIMCHQAGIDNAVASSGTAFTESHLRKLEKLSKRILFVFDGDGAGFQAGLKSATLALSLGMEVKLAELPKGDDPAEMIRKNPDGFKEAMKKAKHLIDFHLDNIIALGLENRKLGKEIEGKILPHIAKLASSMEQSHFVSQISKRTGIKEEIIWNDLKRLPRGNGESPPKVIKEVITAETKHRKDYVERRLIGIILWQEDKKEEDRWTDTDKLRKSLDGILEKEYLAEAFKRFEVNREELVFEAEAYYGKKENLEQDLTELLLNLEEDVLREKFVLIMRDLGTAEKNGEEKRSKELLKICQELTEKMATLSQRRIQV